MFMLFDVAQSWVKITIQLWAWPKFTSFYELRYPSVESSRWKNHHRASKWGLIPQRLWTSFLTVSGLHVYVQPRRLLYLLSAIVTVTDAQPGRVPIDCYCPMLFRISRKCLTPDCQCSHSVLLFLFLFFCHRSRQGENAEWEVKNKRKQQRTTRSLTCVREKLLFVLFFLKKNNYFTIVWQQLS